MAYAGTQKINSGIDGILNETKQQEDNTPYIYDQAGLFTDDQEIADITDELTDIGTKYNVRPVIVTADTEKTNDIESLSKEIYSFLNEKTDNNRNVLYIFTKNDMYIAGGVLAGIPNKKLEYIRLGYCSSMKSGIDVGEAAEDAINNVILNDASATSVICFYVFFFLGYLISTCIFRHKAKKKNQY